MTNPTLDALRQSKLATELSDDQCETLAQVMSLRELKEGEVLVKEGTPDDHLYIVIKGVIGVVKNAGTPDQFTLNTLGNGDFAGELGFVDGTQRFASLVALSDARILGLQRDKLESLLHTHPDIVYRVMRAIFRVVHQIQHRLSIQSVELSNYIYKQHGRY